MTVPVPPLDWLSKGSEYLLRYYKRPKLNIRVAENPIGATPGNVVVNPMNGTHVRLWEFYFRVANVGRSEVRQCSARLKLPKPDYPQDLESKMSTFVADTFHKIRNPELDWFEPNNSHLGTSAQTVKKLGKSVDLPPDPERPLYAGTIQVFKMEDGTGNAQLLLTSENGGPMVSSIGLNPSKTHKLTATLRYVWGKESRKKESRNYVLNTNSFANITDHKPKEIKQDNPKEMPMKRLGAHVLLFSLLALLIVLMVCNQGVFADQSGSLEFSISGEESIKQHFDMAMGETFSLTYTAKASSDASCVTIEGSFEAQGQKTAFSLMPSHTLQPDQEYANSSRYVATSTGTLTVTYSTCPNEPACRGKLSMDVSYAIQVTPETQSSSTTSTIDISGGLLPWAVASGVIIFGLIVYVGIRKRQRA